MPPKHDQSSKVPFEQKIAPIKCLKPHMTIFKGILVQLLKIDIFLHEWAKKMKKNCKKEQNLVLFFFGSNSLLPFFFFFALMEENVSFYFSVVGPQ